MPTASQIQAIRNVTQHTQDDSIQHMYTTITNLQLQVTQLSRDITQLHTDNTLLRREVDTLRANIARLEGSPQLPISTLQRWHEEANSIIGAAHSRVAPTIEYKCAHDGCNCNWRELSNFNMQFMVFN